MNLGDIIFVKGTGIASRIIQWVTKSPYSHSAIFVGGGELIEAEAFRRVGFQDLDAYEGRYDVVSLHSSVDVDELRTGLIWLVKQRGRHYSYWSNVVILFRCLFGIRIPWRDRTNVICSRLARDFLFQCGIPIPDEDMSPEDLHKWLLNFSVQKQSGNSEVVRDGLFHGSSNQKSG